MQTRYRQARFPQGRAPAVDDDRGIGASEAPLQPMLIAVAMHLAPSPGSTPRSPPLPSLPLRPKYVTVELPSQHPVTCYLMAVSHHGCFARTDNLGVTHRGHTRISSFPCCVVH